MKKQFPRSKFVLFLNITMLTCFAFIARAQAPQGINYQAVVRNSQGQTLPSGVAVSMRFTIHDSTATGTPVFQETTTATTNQFGLVVHVIGSVNNLETVNWGRGEKFLQVEVDVNGGTNFTDMGTSQLMSVPYALYAGNTANGVTGATGVTGANGLNGAIGVTGPQGATGPQGLQGVTGNTGADGNDGANGLNGATGVTGQQGIAGATGADGQNGTNGLNGATGATGPQGLPGVTGATGTNGQDGINGLNGATGVTGPQGSTGATGANGQDGTNGLNGATGATGPQGLQGVTGATGANGHDGINGLDGATGATGSQGLQGVTGNTGATGANGQDGTNGLNGITGATGPQGLQGVTGTTGANGQDGTNGLNGATGATGPQGLQGVTGNTGATGANGQDGTNGLNGVTGQPGQQGLQGVTGNTGATGASGQDGTNGLNGVTGATGIGGGATGATGPQGATGATGANGQDGNNGLNGTTGATGVKGVTGSTGLTGATGATGFLASGASTGNTAYWNGSQWVLNSSNIYNNGGNVGIGTNNPLYKQHLLFGGNTDGLMIQNTTGSGTGTANLYLTGYSDVVAGVSHPAAKISATDDAQYSANLTFWTKIPGFDANNLVERMRIADNGNIGIGTTNPSAKLEVIGSTKTTNFQMTNGAASNYILASDASGNASWVSVASVSLLGPTGPTGATGYLNSGAAAGNTPYWDGSQWIVNSSNIFNNGSNVGVATSSPAATLDVNGKTKTVNFQMTNGAANGSTLKSDANGNGTWVTQHDTSLYSTDGTLTGNRTVNMGSNNVTFNSAGGNLILTGANLGIGTSAPNAPLVISSAGQNMRDINEGVLNQSSTIPPGGFFTQTFTPNYTGLLVSITLYSPYGVPSDTIVYTIYEGNGTTGTVLASKSLILVNHPSGTDFITFNASPTLTAGKVYTFAVQSSATYTVGVNTSTRAGPFIIAPLDHWPLMI